MLNCFKSKLSRLANSLVIPVLLFYLNLMTGNQIPDVNACVSCFRADQYRVEYRWYDGSVQSWRRHQLSVHWIWSRWTSKLSWHRRDPKARLGRPQQSILHQSGRISHMVAQDKFKMLTIYVESRSCKAGLTVLLKAKSENDKNDQLNEAPPPNISITATRSQLFWHSLGVETPLLYLSVIVAKPSLHPVSTLYVSPIQLCCAKQAALC